MMRPKTIAKAACLTVGLMWGISSERRAQAVTCFQLVNCTPVACSWSTKQKCEVQQSSAIHDTAKRVLPATGGYNLQSTKCGKHYPWNYTWCSTESDGTCGERTSANLC